MFKCVLNQFMFVGYKTTVIIPAIIVYSFIHIIIFNNNVIHLLTICIQKYASRHHPKLVF